MPHKTIDKDLKKSTKRILPDIPWKQNIPAEYLIIIILN